MRNTFQTARLVEPDVIRLIIFTDLLYERVQATLVVDHQHNVPLPVPKVISTSNLLIADYKLPAPLELGHSYALAIPSFPIIPLDVSEATTFPNFDLQYSYDGNDLGATYKEEATEWVVWAPLASSVTLKVKREKKGRWHYREMLREERGIYRLRLKGDYDGAYYTYLVVNSELTTEAIDPYAKASGPNGEYSVVLNPKTFPALKRNPALPRLQNPTEAIIYEASVRDMTSDSHTDIEHKGKYLGLIEKNRKTTNGLPAGFDYLCSLGFTHLQLMPFYDFSTIDERHPESSYNWGYDPKQYFVPEGSYAIDVEDPLARLKECQTMIASFHEAGIRVTMDAVYNHVYEYQSSSFERIVPNYYFRRRKDGKIASTSGCGDDLASERPMVRKLIVDSAKWWIDQYGVDGFRFDLMGIIDVETLKIIEKYGKEKDPSFLVYGEGWNMGGEVPLPLGTMDNARLLPGFAYFNDIYREAGKDFLAANFSSFERWKFAYLGSSLEYSGIHPRFLDARQSLNYLECHDDKVLYDVLSDRRPDLGVESKCDLIKMGNALIALSFGIPFFHMGQEIGASKFGENNTHNKGDKYNRFSYRLLEERKDMYDYFKSLLSFRKKCRAFHFYDQRVIAPLVEYENLNGGLRIHLSDPQELRPYRELDFFFNVSENDLSYQLCYDHELVINRTGDVSGAHVKVENLLIPKHSFIAVALPLDEN